MLNSKVLVMSMFHSVPGVPRGKMERIIDKISFLTGSQAIITGTTMCLGWVGGMFIF